MGKRGPAPKPTPLRMLRGETRPSRIPVEPSPSPGPCDPPAHLSIDTRAVWVRLQAELESKSLLAPRYLEAFEVFCDAVVQYRRAAAVLAQTGPVVKGRGGEMVSNPASREFARFGKIVAVLAQQFGLTPSAVTAIGLAAGRGPVDRSDPARLLG